MDNHELGRLPGGTGLSPAVEPASSLAGSAASIPSAQLDQKGRCCGRKPIPYKRSGHWFCTKCDRAYRMPDGKQQANWAWKAATDGFTATYPDQEPYRTMTAQAIEARRAATTGAVEDESAVPQGCANPGADL